MMRWRPRLAGVLFAVNLLIFLLPLGGIAILTTLRERVDTAHRNGTECSGRIRGINLPNRIVEASELQMKLRGPEKSRHLYIRGRYSCRA